VTSEECQKEIFYFEKMEADDYRNDPLLAEACHQDVIDYCDDVEPGADLVVPNLSALTLWAVFSGRTLPGCCGDGKSLFDLPRHCCACPALYRLMAIGTRGVCCST